MSPEPDDINEGRRATRTTESSDGLTDDGLDSDELATPGEINEGRRQTDDDTTDTDDSTKSGAPTDVNRGRRQQPTSDRETATDEGGGEPTSGTDQTTQAPGVADPQGGQRQLQEESLEEQVARESGNAVTQREVDVTVGDQGVEDVEVFEQTPVVAGRQGGRRQIQERAFEQRVADQGGDALTRDEVTARIGDEGLESVTVNELVPTVADPEGGQRKLQAESLERDIARSTGLDEDIVEVGLSDEGGTARIVQTAADIERRAEEQFLEENPEFEEGDVDTELRERPGGEAIAAEGGRPIREDTSTFVDVQLTEQGKQGLVARKIAEEREELAPSDVEVMIGDEGEVENVEVDEQFGDDDGRVLGIAGGEDFLEPFAEGYSEFAEGVGEGVGNFARPLDWAAQPFAGLTDARIEAPFRGAVEAGVTGVTQLGNIPGGVLALDEGGELIGAGLAAEFKGEGGEFRQELGIATERKVDAAVEYAKENPTRALGGVVGTAVGSAGLLRQAQRIGPRAGETARYVVQPGEELIAAGTGFRLGTAVSKSVRGAKARAANLRSSKELNIADGDAWRFSQDDRGQLNFERTRSRGKQKQKELTGEETAADFDKPVMELNVSEATRREILERTARDSDVKSPVLTREADMALSDVELRELRKMPPARAFENPSQFSKAFQRRIKRAEAEERSVTAPRETVTTARTKPLQTVVTVGTLTASGASTINTEAESLAVEAQTPEVSLTAFESDLSLEESLEVETGAESVLEAESELVAAQEIESVQEAAVETAVEQEISITDTEAITEALQETSIESSLEAESTIETEIETETEVVTELELDSRRDIEVQLDRKEDDGDEEIGLLGFASGEAEFDTGISDIGDLNEDLDADLKLD